jgi:hypothetical protein
MTNGSVETATEIELDVSQLTYGMLRKLRKLQASNPEAAEDYFDELVALVVPGGIDDLPFLEAKAVLDRLGTLLREGMAGKDQPAAPSSQG